MFKIFLQNNQILFKEEPLNKKRLAKVPVSATVDYEANTIAFPLMKVSKENIPELRELSQTEKIPMVFVKVKDNFYYAEILREMNCAQIIIGSEPIRHKCCFRTSNRGEDQICAKLGARKSCCEFFSVVEEECHVEKFPFIRECIESINTRAETFSVLACEQYSLRTTRKKDDAFEKENNYYIRKDYNDILSMEVANKMVEIYSIKECC